MTVSDLIELLKQQPPDMAVMMDVTHETSTVFKFKSVDVVDEIETIDKDKFVLLSCGVDEDFHSDN